MNCIASLYSGPMGDALKEISLPFIRRYACDCGVKLVLMPEDLERPPSEERSWGKAQFLMGKLFLRRMQWVRELFGQGYDRILWIDGDVLIRPDSPNLFEMVPKGSVAAFDEYPVCDKNDKHYRERAIEEIDPIPEGVEFKYYNCGVLLVPSIRKDILIPHPKAIGKIYSWSEQSSINVALRNKPVHNLPLEFNRFFYWGPMRGNTDPMCGCFHHFAGGGWKLDRLKKDMTKMAERMRN